MTIKLKITLLLSIALLALLVVSAVGLWQLSAAQARFEYISSNTFPSLKALQSAQVAMYDMRTSLRNHVSHVQQDKKQEDEKAIESKRLQFDKAVGQYEAELAVDDTDRQMVKQAKADMAQYRTAMDEFFNNSRSNYMSVATAMLESGTLYQLSGKLEADLNKLINYNYQLGNRQNEANHSAYVTAKWLQMSLALAALLLTAIGGWWLIRAITRSLTDMQHTMEQLSRQRDFKLRVHNASRDELGRTAKAFNSLLDSLQQNLQQLQHGAQDVMASSHQMNEAADTIFQAASAQSESSAAVAATIEQMTVSVNHVAERADEAQRLSQTSSQQAEAGSVTISQTISDIRDISAAIASAGQALRGLNAQSQQIMSVVQVIRDVADQTNLLALNAAIEAARAGEMGRGFAVVADEVRKLAERTASSTQEISASLQAMQQASIAVVEQMNNAEQLVEGGVSRADEADRAILSIGEAAAGTTGMVADISMAIKEQGAASNSIARQVERIAQMSEQANAVAAQTAGHAKSLRSQAEQQMKIISQYQL
ncbi:methyl-accepting chemotaxis protein [Aquitalea sp. LB_tupeE]|uniref:methyl-accepting chemotaxis protein n=1 Tax=Aquitalea sp. LB_tupeE TaxID=2748078 RepID=UPI0015BBFA36|nr:methyl-accepting chemotaxis protein [Aquitalea sp. LB_tupeE]NWK76593.1 methyl-accepting chemotaxis protein [Aquitalea sp. LB_tupeE]